ncbi:MAG: DUF4143 domain-containing protein [Planctomycetes bacterium]|nr:DUF4143 domain-containing protein [Planctomycetota bacterium]
MSAMHHPVYARALYIRDRGLLHFLAGLRNVSALGTWAYRGASFEGLVVEELATLAQERITRPLVAHWRTLAGAEVDLLIGNGRKLFPIEIKLGASVDSRAVAGLRQCMKDLGLEKGWVVYTGKERRSIGKGIEVIPWDEIARNGFAFG